MGKLDEAAFEQAIASCKKCEAKAFEVCSYLDREVNVTLGKRNGDGLWTHDKMKFVLGIYQITCIRCRDVAFSSSACPCCGREDGLVGALGQASRLTVPMRCPDCKGTTMTASGYAPSMVRTGEGQRASPTPIAQFGDPGFHVIKIECDACDWIALAEGCPLCGGPAPLRARP